MSMLSRFATLGGLPGDPYWSNVSYLLVGNGANDTTTNIVDSSSNHSATIVNGNTRIRTAISPPAISGAGSGVVYFDGVGDFLQVTRSAIFALPGDFTIEAWIYPTAYNTAYETIIDLRAAGVGADGVFALNPNGKPSALISPGYWVSTATTVLTNTWTHLAFVRIGATTKVYINGVAESTTLPITGISSAPTYVIVGQITDNINTYGWIGYMYDLRVTKGVGRYTANYTPAPFPPTSAMPTS